MDALINRSRSQSCEIGINFEAIIGPISFVGSSAPELSRWRSVLGQTDLPFEYNSGTKMRGVTCRIRVHPTRQSSFLEYRFTSPTVDVYKYSQVTRWLRGYWDSNCIELVPSLTLPIYPLLTSPCFTLAESRAVHAHGQEGSPVFDGNCVSGLLNS